MLSQDEKTKLITAAIQVVESAERNGSDKSFRYLMSAFAGLKRTVTTAHKSKPGFLSEDHDERMKSIIKNSGTDEFYYRDFCQKLADEYGVSVRLVQSKNGVLHHLISEKRVVKFVDEDHPKKWNKYRIFVWDQNG